MFRIKKLDIFISKQFGLLFVGTFFICQFVLMMQFLWRYVDELIGKGLTLELHHLPVCADDAVLVALCR